MHSMAQWRPEKDLLQQLRRPKQHSNFGPIEFNFFECFLHVFHANDRQFELLERPKFECYHPLPLPVHTSACSNFSTLKGQSLNVPQYECRCLNAALLPVQTLAADLSTGIAVQGIEFYAPHFQSFKNFPFLTIFIESTLQVFVNKVGAVTYFFRT